MVGDKATRYFGLRVRHCWPRRRHFDTMITVWIIGDTFEILFCERSWLASCSFNVSDRVQKVAITRGIKPIWAMPVLGHHFTGKLRDDAMRGAANLAESLPRTGASDGGMFNAVQCF